MLFIDLMRSIFVLADSIFKNNKYFGHFGVILGTPPGTPPKGAPVYTFYPLYTE